VRHQNNLEAWIPIRPALNSSIHGYILFEFLPIGREEKNGVVVRFAEGRKGEGLVCIAEVRKAVIQCIVRTSATINMLIEFR
jgi:hypothetical protein